MKMKNKAEERGGAESVAAGLSVSSWSEQNSMHLLC